MDICQLIEGIVTTSYNFLIKIPKMKIAVTFGLDSHVAEDFSVLICKKAMHFINVNYVFYKEHVDLYKAEKFNIDGYLQHNNSRVLFLLMI